MDQPYFMRGIKYINKRITNYLRIPGDNSETILQKKIWWLFSIASILIMVVLSFFLKDLEVPKLAAYIDLYMFASVFILLFSFHFYKKGIENYALISQLGLVILYIIKTNSLGGLMAGPPSIWIALIGPAYALVLPNKKRAILVLAIYILGMIATAFTQPIEFETVETRFIISGFFLGVIQVFIILYYFTIQIDKLKKREKDHLEEMDKVKTRFYTNITHEFRTPLTIIMGLAEKLSSSARDHKKFYNEKSKDQGHINSQDIDWTEELEMISRNGNKLLNLTNQMLDLSKLDAGAMKLNLIYDDLSRFLKYLTESFHSLARSKNIDISFISEPEIILMDFDPEKVQEIINNIISNALKFTQNGGLIQFKVLKELSDENVKILITDNGPGIKKEELSKIFDRYFQATQHKDILLEGTGLGLAIAKDLVRLMKGEIYAKSTEGEGSTFTILLPISKRANTIAQNSNLKLKLEEDHLEVSSVEEIPRIDITGEQLQILVVEDNKDVIHYIRSILIPQFTVHFALNGKEGMEMALELIPDLIISDIMMPIMDGFTMCDQLQKDWRTSHIPIIMLTALADSESKIKGLLKGADAYLAKPFSRKELFVRINKLIELRKKLQKRYKQQLSGSFTANITTGKTIEDKFLNKVKSVIEEHMDDEDFTIAELCRILTMSRSQLYRKFNAVTDTTLNKFIWDVRLDHAHELLEKSDLNITQVSIESGFKNLAHFSRVYREKFGKNPSEHKKPS